MIGFFECVDDDAVAAALFDHATSSATARGLEFPALGPLQPGL